MRMLLTTIVAAGLYASSSTAALAQGLQWRVSEAAGSVTVRSGDQSRAAARGTLLQPGDTIQAGPGGRAVLVSNKDFVTVSPNSRVTIPTAQAATGFVKILQDWGNAIFKIEKQGVPHFGVKTPSLAAVVKGTTFSVTVDATGSSLQVTEGAVEVSTIDGGARDLIRPGGVASIAAGDLYRLNVHGDSVRTLDSPARTERSAPAAPSAGSAPESAPPAIPEPATAASAAPEVQDRPVMTVMTVIETPISSKPADLGSLTNGMVVGSTAATQIAAISADVRAAARVADEAPQPEMPQPSIDPAPSPNVPADQPDKKGGAGNAPGGNGNGGKPAENNGGGAGTPASPPPKDGPPSGNGGKPDNAEPGNGGINGNPNKGPDADKETPGTGSGDDKHGPDKDPGEAKDNSGKGPDADKGSPSPGKGPDPDKGAPASDSGNQPDPGQGNSGSGKGSESGQDDKGPGKDQGPAADNGNAGPGSGPDREQPAPGGKDQDSGSGTSGPGNGDGSGGDNAGPGDKGSDAGQDNSGPGNGSGTDNSGPGGKEHESGNANSGSDKGGDGGTGKVEPGQDTSGRDAKPGDDVSIDPAMNDGKSDSGSAKNLDRGGSSGKRGSDDMVEGTSRAMKDVARGRPIDRR